MSKITKVLAGALVLAFVASTSSSAAMTWTRSLKVGSKGADVKSLQQFLNMCSDTKVANSGAGSPGLETTTFGPATKAAVIKFQSARGVSPASGLFGPLSRAKAAELQASSNVCGGGVVVNPPVNQTGPVLASLSATTPAAGTLVAGQATADLAHFTFTGSGAVTGVTLQRIGVSADATPSNVYLFDGATRLVDAASVSNNGMVTFNSPAGIFMVNGSKTIAVKSDIAGSTSGQTVGFRLVSFTTASGVVTANISGNIHNIASATLASVSAGTVSPSGAILNPGAGVTVWQSTLSISQRDVMLKRLAVRQVGSAPANSMNNFKLFVNGSQVATAAGVDSLGYVTFDLSSAPVTLASGSRVVRIDADVVSGASRTVQFSLRQAADVDFVDSSFGVNISPTITPWAPSSASTIGGVSGGSMTIEKDTTSPSQNITLNGNDAKLGTFKVTAYGEAIKLETLKAGFTYTDAGATANVAATLRNGRIMINGVQYGSSSTLVAAGTTFTTNYVVYPGTSVMVDVYADVYDNDGTALIEAADTIQAKLVTGSSNAIRQDSLGSFNAPAADVSANALTVASASVTLAKNATYANQTVVVPQSGGYKIGSWNLAGSSVEDVLLSTLSFDVDETVGATLNESDLTNLTAKMFVNGVQVASPAPLGTVAAADNNFSVSYTLAKNASAVIELWSTIGSGATAADAFKTDLTVTGTSMVSGQAISAADVDGQTIIAGAGSLTATTDAGSPVTAIVADNQTVDVAGFKFAAVNDAYNVTDINLTIADASNVANVMLYDGTTLVASKPGAATVAFNGLSWNVPSNTNKVLTVKLQLGSVGSGAGTSGASLLTTLTSATATAIGAGTSAAVTESDPASTAMYVYAAIPTITNVALPTTILSTGDQTVSKFTVGTNGSGTIAWKKLIFTVTRAISGTDTLATPTLWDADTNTQIAGTPAFTGSVEADNGTSGTITFVATNEQQISGSKTYELRVTIAGAPVAGDNINVKIAQPSSYAAPAAYATVAATTPSFTWSDVSAVSHSATTTDWNNGFLVKNLPTATQGLSK